MIIIKFTLLGLTFFFFLLSVYFYYKSKTMIRSKRTCEMRKGWKLMRLSDRHSRIAMYAVSVANFISYVQIEGGFSWFALGVTCYSTGWVVWTHHRPQYWKKILSMINDLEHWERKADMQMKLPDMTIKVNPN